MQLFVRALHLLYPKCIYEVDPFVNIVDEDILLLVFETETGPHLPNKVLKSVKDSSLKIRFIPIPLRFQSEEFKNCILLDEVLSVQLLRSPLRQCGKFVWIFCPTHALIILALDLTAQGSHAPCSANRLKCVERPHHLHWHFQQFNDVRE